MSTMQQRKDEILAKKAKLAELKRQRELRQKEFQSSRQSVGAPAEFGNSPGRSENRKELDDLISSLVGNDKGPPTPRDPSSPSLAIRSRPLSYASPHRPDLGEADGTPNSPAAFTTPVAPTPQHLSFAPLAIVYEISSDPIPRKEVITYSKGVQTTNIPWPQDRPLSRDSEFDEEAFGGSPNRRRPNRRQREKEEELRESLRKEIEEELKALQQPEVVVDVSGKQNFPARALNDEELEAVVSSNEFLDFVDRSSKVIERALDEEYDVLADYRFGTSNGFDEEDGLGAKGRKGRRVKEVLQFYDQRWSKKRMISDIGFSPVFPELVLAAYTKNPSAPYEPAGLVQVWNTHMHDRPEYVFHATSDVLTAKFSPFQPSLIVGGSYSGQVMLWDTRSKSSAPIQKTPLTGSGHTHPVYSINIVGTQNAHNIISTSTDGVVCSWSVDMLSQPQEFLELLAPSSTAPVSVNGTATTATTAYTRPDDLAPLCTAFPSSDPTYFLTGTEEGPIHLCHRYDRAGAKAGVDSRTVYRGHTAPVMSLDFHRATGALDLGDLVLSSGLDWSVKLWRVRTPTASAVSTTNPSSSATITATTTSTTTTAATSRAGATAAGTMRPLLEMQREDVVYDAKWSPTHPGVFACVDGAGYLEVWDLLVDVEVPVARVAPTPHSDLPGAAAGPVALDVRGGVAAPRRSLNKCAWEGTEGRRVAVGGLDGVLSVFEVGSELGGLEGVKHEEWMAVKKLVGRLESR